VQNTINAVATTRCHRRFRRKVGPPIPPSSNVEQAAVVSDDMPDSAVNSRPPIRSLAFDDIYRTFFEDVRRWIRALGGPEAEREDLAQDVFLIVHRRLPDFDGENIVGWLYQITRHRVRDFRRLRWFQLFSSKRNVDESLAATSEGPDGALHRKDGERILARLLDKLPEVQRATFVLFEIEGYSGEEIARFQGVSVNTVWARIHKARAKMIANLKRVQRETGRG
jgi:RNA polymerase sigma-70 factor (ECF subfamily)